MRFQIYSRKTQTKAKQQIICFPCAGADAVLFRDWGEFLGPEIKVIAARYTGRGSRLAEPPKKELKQICEDLQEEIHNLLNLPTYFFGHSLGAIVAFELANYLEQSGQSIEKLFVSAAAAPRDSEREREHFHHWDDQAFQKKLLSLGGVPELITQHPDLLNFLTPMIRADIQAIETYQYQETLPLNCPISVFLGREDPVLKNEIIENWETHSSAKVRFHQFNGSHFYFQEDPLTFFKILKSELSKS